MPADFTVLPALPEIILAAGALVLLMIGAFGGERATPVVTGLSVALIIAAAVGLLLMPTEGQTFEGAFTLDSFARLMKIVTLIGSGVAIAMSVGYARAEKFERFEYPILIVTAT